ncbi:MAG: phage major capsid protein [Streptococcus hyointestinalis]|uniref:phage major capsid protein n=1 Tax=Streptococcus hyointestinalis TaxID=1337 RepID=UPI0023F483B2|nr:phage major capsid protein [Streptococcus hyointestinalis]MCI6871582.1 phage major capsid protein [Streptococcus hyointestinalis]MDD7355927.1 phage major capsid protein [Streptococcus hyointestinalis]MDY4553639.1 phage major capsid protein [Streptococcus hyointestinalis]
MNKTVNELNELWISAGHKVEDLNEKINAALNDDSFSAESFKELKAERDNAKARRDALHEQMIEAQAQAVVAMSDDDVEELTEKEKDIKDTFVKNFVSMVKGDPTILAQVSSDTDESGNQIGLTIPQDIRTTINKLVRRFDSLEQYVNKESVTTPTGSRVFEKWSDIKPLANLDAEDAAIGDNDDPKLTLVKYAIKRYAGITTATNTLLKDTAENILAWLSDWIAKKVVVTRNLKIIEAMDAVPAKPTITSFDDIKDLALKGVDPAIRSTSFFLTNTSGITELAKVKDAMGNYLLQRDVTQPDRYLIEGKQVVEIADKWLPSKSGNHPLYFGDLKQAVTLFDREHLSLLTTNIGAGAFEKDLTKIRVIDRFDVVTTDKEAFVAGSFKKVADQAGNLKTTAGA